LLALEEGTGVVAIVRLERLVALPLEIADDDLAHDRFVVDDEDGGHSVIVQARARARQTSGTD